MLLSEYIKGLQDFLDKNGDMVAYYSSDDEGNSYQEVSWCGSLMYLPDSQQGGWHPELYCQQDIDDGELDEDDEVIPVVVVN